MLLEHDVYQESLKGRIGPVLRDGTAFRDLFDFDNKEVQLRVMSDPEIYDIEQDRIFGRAWFAVGHESEIPNHGDFLLRSIGQDAVIVTRAKDGSINVLLNVCAHRGMEVCFADHGNTETFKCPYHAWIYDNTGRLLAVPFEDQMYPSDWDKSRYGLRRVRTEVRHGVIFATLNDKGPGFEDFLGEDMLWYFDTLFGTNEWKALKPAIPRARMQANWKANLDQNNGDALHATFLHKSLEELGLFGEPFGQYCVKVVCPPHGHQVIAVEGNFIKDYEAMRERNKLPLTERILSYMIYPTTTGFSMSAPLPDGTPAGMRVLQSHSPHGVSEFEYRQWQITLVPKDLSDEQVAGFYQMGGDGGGVMAGNAMEDYDAWRSITKASQGRASRQATLKYPSTVAPSKVEGWDHGVVYDGISRDDSQWQGWLHYFDMMTADEA